MGDLTLLRESILRLDGKPASHVTNALKNTGGKNGTMIDGLLAIVDYCDGKIQDTKFTYGVGGALCGAGAVTALGGGIYVYKMWQKRNLLEREEKRIIKAFDEQSVLVDDMKTQAAEDLMTELQ